MTEHIYGESVIDFGEGDRVELHPSVNWWGARFGTVLRPRPYHQTTMVKIKLDKLRGAKYVAPYLLRKI